MGTRLLVKRGELRDARLDELDEPQLDDGQALLRVSRFGMTTNNVTYALMGEVMRYWEFFPAPEGWGTLPAWGFAEVAKGVEGLDEGTRLYGYLPAGSHLVVQPERIDERGFFDGSAHRAELPSAYQGYRRIGADLAYHADREDEQIIFWPLYYTSFLVDDFLADEDFFGAATLVISSASSKTAIIAAYLLAQRRGVEPVGLTSPGNAEFVEGLGIYDEVVPYGEIADAPGDRAVYVDFSGDGEVRRDVHERYGDSLAHDAAIGVTHWEKTRTGMTDSEGLSGPKPVFFFAPDRITKRGADWGTAELDRRVADTWHPFAEWAGGWLEVDEVRGGEELRRVYLEVLEGRIDPRSGYVVTLPD